MAGRATGWAVRRTAAFGGGFFLVAILAALAWHMSRDPLAMLPYEDAAPIVLSDEARIVDGRLVRDLVLDTGGTGRARLRLSLPSPLPSGRLSAILVLGGQRTGSGSIALVGDVGLNALVGYDWPLPSRMGGALDVLGRLPELYSGIVRIPGQIEAALQWISAQPWADRERTSLVGFSLGALAAPAVQRLLEARGHRIGWTVIAYGGTPIGDLAAHHPRVRPEWLRPFVGTAVDILLRAVEPDAHLPRLVGCFLVVSGEDDELIPLAAARRVEALTPQCRTIERLAGEQLGIGPNEAGLLDAAMRSTTRWLEAQGAVNPIPHFAQE
jgi:hypothetical protein